MPSAIVIELIFVIRSNSNAQNSSMPPKKKKKTETTTKQSSLIGKGFARKPKGGKYIGTDVLLTDKQVGYTKVPEDARGKNFLYSVYSYDAEEDTFSLTYQKKAVDPNVVPAVLVAFDEKTKYITLDDVAFIVVKEGRLRF